VQLRFLIKMRYINSLLRAIPANSTGTAGRPTCSAKLRLWTTLRPTAINSTPSMGLLNHGCTSVPLLPPLWGWDPAQPSYSCLLAAIICHRCSAATDNGNLKHTANLTADEANVDDRKWPHVAAMLNGRHTAGSVTWLAFRPFDIPTPVKWAR